MIQTPEKGKRIAIVQGLRTPFAKQLTYFSKTHAIELGSMLISELIARLDFPPHIVEQLIFGQVLVSPDAPNIAREVVLSTRLSESTDAFSVSRACATSFQSVISLAESMMAGAVSVGIAGGADSASVVPIGVSKPLSQLLMDLSKTKDWSKKMALLSRLRPKHLLPVPPAAKEYSTGLKMGDTAEQMARDYGISREEQDAFAHGSHTKAAAAWESGSLADEVMTAYVKPYKESLHKDNLVRANSDLKGYAKLKPAFDRRYGTLTAANSSALTDGAAAVLMMTETQAKNMGVEVLGYIRSYATTATSVAKDMLMGPSFATPLALDRAGMKLSDIDLIDMHEAFAAQVLCNVKAFESTQYAKEKLNRTKAIGSVDFDKFNVLGGSLAFGHPFAATGARMITQVMNELKRRGGGTALTTACAAGGLGAAIVLEVEA